MMVVSFGGGRMIGNLPFHCLVAVKRSKPWNLENPPHELYSLPLPPPSLQEGRERERERLQEGSIFLLVLFLF